MEKKTVRKYAGLDESVAAMPSVPELTQITDLSGCTAV